MADVQSNIKVSIDTTDALTSIKNLQRQISAFHTSMAQSGAAANAVTGQMQQNLINSINATGKFSAQMKTIKTTTESFTDSLQKNKFSLGEYFRFAGGASKSFGRLFKTEFDTINKVARENVKDLQTQYIKMGRDANGAMRAIAVRPLTLDMNDLATKTMIASERQALLNQLLKQGSTNLLNFGKNTQWAGRQLMVGFTIPLMAAGTAAAKSFMDMEKQAIRFKKVYGDLFTSTEESTAALENIKELGKSLTQYGIAVADTVGVASEAAAAGFAGVDLQRQTEQSIRLSILGQVDYQKALETTISVQNAFGISSDQLAESIDFLNAVENQTVVSLDDITTAIPKVAPVIKQLGGDVKDLAFLMTAMKEGGINASEGANALKSGLASMINPTGKAVSMLESFGINIKKIVVDNRGDLKKTIVDFATALNQLDPLNRAQAIEQMFGKFQFARLSTLFANVTKEGTQAARVLDLAGSSVQELANLSEKELGMTAESSMNKFKKAVEDLKLALVPVGEEFLKAVTPVAQFVADILEKFNGLSAGTKKIIVTITAIVAGLGPVFLMTFGLLANGLANIIKGFTFLKSIFNKAGQSTATLGTEVKYMTLEQRNAAAVAASLDQVHKTLAQTFTAEASAVDALTRAYQRSIAAQAAFIPASVPMGRGPVTKRATGKPSVVGGTGNKDTELALLTPGETVIPADMSDKYGFLINGMIADNIPGYIKGKKGIAERTQDVPVYGDLSIFIQDRAENQSQGASAPGLQQVLAPLVARVGEARGLGFSQQTQVEHYPGIIEEYTPIVQRFVDTIETEMESTKATVVSENERLARAWQTAGRSVEAELAAIPNEVERGRVRQALGVEADSYGSVAGDFRANHGWGGRTGRYAPGQGPVSYMDPNYRKGTSAAYELLTGEKVDPKKQDYGHTFDVKTRKTLGLPTSVPLSELRSDPLTLPSTVSGIDNSISREEAKAAASRTVGQATETTEQAVTAVRKTAKTASPSKRTIPVGEDIARGLTEGMKKETPRVVSEANKMTDSAINATRTRTRRSASRPQGAPKPSGSEVVATAATRGQRGYRSSSRPQGPSNNIGPLMPANATALSLIGLTSQERKEIDKERSKQARTSQIKSRAKSIGGRVNSFGGGMGLLGANMGLSMLPDFAGKGIAQGGLAGANLGMMFGPWGMAAGAAIGTVSTAISGLIEKQKQLKAMNEATFKSSADVATFFGNAVVDTTLKVGSFTNSIRSMSTSAEGAGKSFGYTNEELSKFIALIESLPENNPLKQIVDGLANEDNPEKINKIAQAFIATQVAIGQIKPEQAQKTLDLILASSGKVSMVGSTFVNFTSQVQATTQMLKNAAGNSTNLGNSLIQLTGAAANSSSLAQLTGIIDGIAAAGISGAAALTSMYNAYLLIGNTQAATGVKILRNVSGITGEQTAFLIAAAAKGFSKQITSKTTAEELVKEAQIWLDKNQDRIFKKTGGAPDITKTKAYKDQEKESSGIKKQLDLLKKKKKVIDDQIKQQEKITNEIKRQNDYLDKQRDIDQQIVEAKIKGNYIEAASLLQEKNQNTVEFNQETEKSKLQEQSDLLQAQIDALELANSKVVDAINKASANQAAATAAAASSIVDAITGGGFSFNGGGRARRNRSGQPFAVTTTPAPANTNTVGGPTVNQTVVDPKTGKRVMLQEGYFSDKLSKYANSSNWKKGDVLFIGKDGDIPAIITNDVTKPKRTGSIEVTGIDQNSGSFQYRVKAAKGGYIQGFEPGGKVSGPGTSTSDSIPALLSDGEYVFSAKAVDAAGGPGIVEGWHNALRRADGGPAWKKPKSAYNSKNQPTGNPRGRYWGELERLYQGSPLSFDKNGNPIFNNAGKDPWGGIEIPGLPFKGKVANFSDYWHQLAEQPRKSSGPGMGLDKDPMRYAGSGASMGGIGNGAYGFGPLMLAKGGPVKKRATSLFDKSIWEKTSNFFGLPQMGKTALDLGKYGGPQQMILARLLGRDMKSSLSDNAIAALNVIPIPVGKALKPLLKLVPNSLKTLLAKNGIGKISTRIDEASKSIYKKEDISVGEEIFPTYKIGNKQESFAFQGYKENLSSLSKSGVTTVETTPEGLLSAALGLSPNNRNISTMLDNFKNNKLGQEEYTFLDDISASVSINSKGIDPGVEKTDGFAMVLAALSGDKNAKKIIEYKRKKFYDLVEKAKASNKSHRDASGYKPKEGPVDPASVPVIHSTGYSVTRDKNGDVILNPYGDFNIGTDKAVPRGSLHTTLYAPVESHLMGQWDASQTRIVSSLGNMTQANGLPYNVNATDTWWQVNPGQGLTVPNPSIIRSFKDSKSYREELIRRGLLQPTEMTPPLSVDSGLKEVLHLQKEAYNSVERLQISRIAREMGLAREVVPGQETAMLQEIALRHAKQQQGVDPSKARLEQWGLSSEDLNQHIYRIAEQYGLDSGIHSGSNPEILEKILMRESSSKNQNGIPSFSKLFVDSLEAIRMATRHGRFKTEIEKIKDPFDEFANGGYVSNKKQMPGFAMGGLTKSKMSMPNYKLPSYDVGSPYIPEDQIAQLHKGERVLTAEENKNFSSSGPVTNNITINGADKDPKQIAQEVMIQLERIQSKNNKTNLVGG